MPRNVVLIAVLLLSLPIIAPSSAVAMPANTLTILPADCKLLVGQELLLTIDGFIPPSAKVTWDVSRGGITSMLPGQEAILVAPSEPMVVTISVSISSAVPSKETPITRQCIITSLNKAPTGLAEATGHFFEN